MRERWKEMSRLGRAVLTFTAAGSVSLALLVAAFFLLPAIGSPSGDALQYSLTRNAGGSLVLGGVYDCERRSSAIQVCDISDAHNSGKGRYRVRMDGRRCYHARKFSPDAWEEGPPHLEHRVSGCVKWRDQLRLMDRL
jgi:hypothetical protein